MYKIYRDYQQNLKNTEGVSFPKKVQKSNQLLHFFLIENKRITII
jgi:hypothetical protein